MAMAPGPEWPSSTVRGGGQRRGGGFGWAAERRGVVDVEICACPQNQRRLATGAGRGAEPYRGAHRRAAIITERWMLFLTLSQLGLDRRRDQAKLVETANVCPLHAGTLEL